MGNKWINMAKPAAEGTDYNTEKKPWDEEFLYRDNILSVVLPRMVIEDFREDNEKKYNKSYTLHLLLNLTGRDIIEQFISWCRHNGINISDTVSVRRVDSRQMTEFFITPDSANLLTSIGVPKIDYHGKATPSDIAIKEALEMSQCIGMSMA